MPAKRRDTCNRGHKLVEGNFTWRADGTRRCMVCERMMHQQRRIKAKGRLKAEQVAAP